MEQMHEDHDSGSEPASNSLLRVPNIPCPNRHTQYTVKIAGNAGGKIRFDYTRVIGQINIPSTRIVHYPKEVLLQRVHLGCGGWIHLEENARWIESLRLDEGVDHAKCM